MVSRSCCCRRRLSVLNLWSFDWLSRIFRVSHCWCHGKPPTPLLSMASRSVRRILDIILPFLLLLQLIVFFPIQFTNFLNYSNNTKLFSVHALILLPVRLFPLCTGNTPSHGKWWDPFLTNLRSHVKNLPTEGSTAQYRVPGVCAWSHSLLGTTASSASTTRQGTHCCCRVRPRTGMSTRLYVTFLLIQYRNFRAYYYTGMVTLVL